MQLLSCMRVIESLVFNGPLNTSWTVVNPMVLFINIFRKYQILTVNHFAVEYCVRISIGFFSSPGLPRRDAVYNVLTAGFYFFNDPLGDQLSQNVHDRSSPNFRDW